MYNDFLIVPLIIEHSTIPIIEEIKKIVTTKFEICESKFPLMSNSPTERSHGKGISRKLSALFINSDFKGESVNG